ncbi:MAG: hypothetical protein UT63_C0083G0002 [Candidatus Gottesmanbacteria bacterium GW2011_GWC2_39_8]|uniref:Uncharacterized protein n=1 Tax=Candidatus Gottesmanbacteria bacterium GW2011_GWC2_39_8 TaxID=1618450 RepID=A0A0G0SZW4_9BACT|nr:MAG: hypothetical protein UT63_C0083G0002 [Candidatus Gottesmanbacteria bacterium GW2011_GWC2_39_8]
MDTLNDKSPVENETIELTTEPVPGQAGVLLNIENLVKSHITNIDTLKVEIKKQKEMMDDIFANDETFKIHSEKAKEATKIKTQTKSQIMKRTDVAAINEKIKGMRMDLKELEGALSDYLREYQKMSGANEIEGEDGEVREIILTGKVIKKSSQYKR